MNNVFIRAEVLGENAAGQKHIHLLASNADGIHFWTDDKSIIRSIEPEPHWIPCSHELPDTREFTSKAVLCCTKYGAIYTATYDRCGEWCEELFGDVLTDVIAWMPLPECYREGEGC